MSIIIKWDVGEIVTRRNRFCFNVYLELHDRKLVQQKGGYTCFEKAKTDRANVIGQLYRERYAVYAETNVKQFYFYWLEEVKRPMLAHHSYNTYKNCILNYILPLYGHIKMKDLTKPHIKRLYRRAHEKRPSVARILKTILLSSCKYAVRHGYITDDPSEGIKWRKESSGKTQKQCKKALTIEEVRSLINAARDTQIYVPILFAVLMGLRRSEIVGLKYSDINYEKKQIRIKRQLGVNSQTSKEDVLPGTYTKQEIKVKTPSSRRSLEMPTVVFDAVMEERSRYQRQRKRRSTQFQDLDYIYSSSYGRPRTSGYLWKQLNELTTENGLPHTTWRNLRYTYTTTILKAGYELRAVSRSLGHTKKSFTADTYVDMGQIIEGYVAKEPELAEKDEIWGYQLPKEMMDLLVQE